MENTKYVTINDLREKWLNQQQKQEEEEEEEEEDDDDKELMPKKYVTIVDLRERWLKQQKQQQEEEDRMKKANLEDEKSQEDVKSERNKPQLQNPNLIKGRNPNCNNRREFHGEKTSEINDDTKIDCRGQLKATRDRINRIINGETHNPYLGKDGEYGEQRDEGGIDEKKMNGSTRKKLWKKRQRIPADNVVQVNQITGLVMGDSVTENAKIRKKKKKKKKKVGRVRNGVEEIEEKMKEATVTEKRFGAVTVNDSTLKVREIEIEAGVDCQGELKDTQIVKDDHKKLRRDLRLKKMKENKKRNRLVNGESHNVVPEKRSLAIGKGTEVIEKRISEKEGECEEVKEKISADGVDESIGDNVVEVNHVTGLVMGSVMTEDGKCWKKKAVGRTRNGVNDQMEEIEAKMKEVTVTEKCFPVTGTRKVVQERWVPRSNANVKEVQVLERGIQVTEDGNASKNDGYGEEGTNVDRVDVRYGDRRTMANRKIEFGMRGRRVYKSWNEGEGNRDKGLMWVKKGDALEKPN